MQSAKTCSTVSKEEEHTGHRLESKMITRDTKLSLVGIRTKAILQSRMFNLIGIKLFQRVKLPPFNNEWPSRKCLAEKTENSAEESIAHRSLSC